ncbi:hypothetical protein Ancab_012599 [Ancistrocladus abbreviatus]
MGRIPCCSKEGLNRGAWTAMEDKILTDYIKIHGEGKWRNLPIKAGLKRCGKSCRLRWLNYLKPDIKRGNITHDEEDLIIRLHKLLGNRWSLIAGRLPGRTDNEIKNYWNTNIGKKVEGHPSSTTSRRKLTNQSNQPNISFGKQASVTRQQNAPCAVRTKATRCTKLFIPQDLQKRDDQNDARQIVNEPFVGHRNEDSKLVRQGSPGGPSSWAPGEPNSTDYFMDVDMDEQFLSEILEANFSLHFNVDSKANGEVAASDRVCSPQTSNQSFFHSEEIREESDTNWLDGFLDSNLDWPQKLKKYEYSPTST